MKGALAFALNVGGPAVTATDGTVFAADTGAGWTNGRIYTDGDLGAPALAGGDYDRDGVTDGDDTVHLTERFNAGVGGVDPLIYTRAELAPGEYILTLKLAEIYDPHAVPGRQVFDVTSNGVLVLDDLDLAGRGLAADEAVEIDVPVIVGADGILTLEFRPSANRAKVNAMALYQAVVPPEPDPEPEPEPQPPPEPIPVAPGPATAGTDGSDRLMGTAGGDVIAGGRGDDDLRGRTGDDVLQGATGNDRLRGGSGDDALHGDAGNDRLLGGAGDDLLAGGRGRDKLKGGEGADSFRFEGGVDVVLDFAIGEDLIDLTRIEGVPDLAGVQAAMRRRDADTVIDLDDRLIVLRDVEAETLIADHFVFA